MLRIVSPLELVQEETKLRTEEMIKKGELLLWDCEQVYDRELRAHLQESFSYDYPYKDQAEIPSKLTVSEVKRMQEPVDEESIFLYKDTAENAPDAEEIQESYIPAFMREEEVVLEGAERGTAYHRVLECLDYTCLESLDHIKEQLDTMVSKGRLTSRMREAVQDREIYKFVKSSLGQRMKAASMQGALYREQPFVMSVPANQIQERYDSGEEILMQGMIDAYFEEDGELVLVDYKTDKVWNRRPENLVEKYQVQLQYYKEALERLTQKKVKEVYLYSLYLGREILV